MCHTYDKIRILWIDDCEGWDATKDIDKLLPESKLPSSIGEYFEILSIPGVPGPSSVRCPSDMVQCLKSSWLSTTEATSIFPPDIIAMDYNLSKWSSLSVEMEMQPLDLSMSYSQSPVKIGSAATTQSVDAVVKNFEGLVLGLFVSSLYHDHPMGVVPMTHYDKSLSTVPEVQTLHLISKNLLDIDYENFGVAGEDRRWSNVLTMGVSALRLRIACLYKNHEIVLSPSDLMEMYEKPDDVNMLHMVSSHASRAFPVQGLFMDISMSQRSKEISAWAKTLLQHIVIDSKELSHAKELASIVWDAYNNDQLVSQRERLSILASIKKYNGKEFNSEQEVEYNHLSNVVFSISKHKCMNNAIDIRSGKYSEKVQRLATLIILKNLLARVIQVKYNVDQQLTRRCEIPDTGVHVPIINENDLYLALFPVSSTSIILPWHKEGGWVLDQSDQWVKHLKKIKLSARDVLAGYGWSEDGPMGLNPSERILLQGLAYEEHGPGWWQVSEQAKCILGLCA